MSLNPFIVHYKWAACTGFYPGLFTFNHSVVCCSKYILKGLERKMSKQKETRLAQVVEKPKRPKQFTFEKYHICS